MMGQIKTRPAGEVRPDDPARETLPATTVLLCVLLAGALSMLCAEVLSGASVLWFVTAWGWLVTLPLYMVHLVFLFSLAVMFRRTSLTSLYLLGVIFGLYESWITKVTWAGYIGTEPGLGTVFGFAPAEFLIIVLFWHPVMSFLLPILLFEVLSPASRREGLLLPGHRWLLAKNKRVLALFTGFSLIGAAFLTVNAGYNAVVAVVTLLGNAGIIGLLYCAVMRRTGRNFSVFSLSLKKRGIFIALAYLALLYVLAFFFLVPERTPPLPTILLTVIIYAVVLLLIWLDRPRHPGTGAGGTVPILETRSLVGFLLLTSVLIVLFSLFPTLGGAVNSNIYLLLVILGPILAVTVAGLVLFRFVKNKKERRGVRE